jgi:hypothetical protein
MMKMTTLIEWLEDFVQQIENPEIPETDNDYDAGHAQGCSHTQMMIALKLRYALEQEKKNAA